MEPQLDRIEQNLGELTTAVTGIAEVVSEQGKRIDGLTKTVAGLTETVSGLTETVGGLTDTVSGLTETVGGLVKTVNEHTRSIDDLTEIVVAMKGYTETELATKTELHEAIEEVKEDLGGKMQGLQRSIDGNYVRQSALESRVLRVETELHI